MPTTAMSFAQMLPRLVAAYDQGILVPFLGAGMSMDLCPGWDELIEALESSSELGSSTPPVTGPGNRARLIQRANSAIRELSLRERAERAKRLRSALYGKAHGTDRLSAVEKKLPQTAALATLKWPLIISSNYDDFFARVYVGKRRFENEAAIRGSGASEDELHSRMPSPYDGYLDVRGRSRAHCAEVLNSLAVPVPSLLWSIHGYLPQQSIPSLEHLERELVVGHDEYRRLAHADPYYRRTFGEVWRRRSLFFVGSGLGDPYLLELFSEIQEIYGSAPQPHFALIGPGSDVDIEHLRSRFNILVLQMEGFDALPAALNSLCEAVASPHPVQTEWAWSLSVDARGVRNPDVAIRHARLPATVLGATEGLLISVGMTDSWRGEPDVYIHDEIIEATLAATGLHGRVMPDLQKTGDGVYHLPGRSVCAIQPWRDASTRDLTLLTSQLMAAFDWARGCGLESLRMPLLGAGASRHFSSVVPLAVLIRAFRAWRLTHPDSKLGITVYIVDPDAIFELRTGRLDVPELLMTDDMRIWVRVRGPELEDVLPEPLYLHDSATLSDVADAIRLPERERWVAEISPSAVANAAPRTLASEESLASLGVVPGATVLFRRA